MSTIGSLDMHCGNCGVIDWCGDEPFDELCLCTDSRLENVSEEDYKKLAEQSTEWGKAEICEDVVRKLQEGAEG